MELAHQLKTDMLKRDKEIEVLQTALEKKDETVHELEEDKAVKVTMQLNGIPLKNILCMK